MITITHSSCTAPVFEADTFASGSNNDPFIWLSEKAFGRFTTTIRALQVAGISVFTAELSSPETTPLTIRLAEPALMMCFTLAGYITMADGASPSFILNEHSHFILSVPGNEAVTLTAKGSARLFVVCFYSDLRSKLLSDDEASFLESKLAGNIWRVGRPVTSPMAAIISAVIHCASNNCLHQIFLTAKMLELLFISLEQLKQTGASRRLPLMKVNDLEKLELAKQIIKDNIKHPYSVIDLAHKVGLNDFKLKKGFRDAFDTTVFGYLLTLRMEKARNMLSSGDHKVSEVAHEVGYKNAHHFSVAFKKKFGYLPSKLFVHK